MAKLVPNLPSKDGIRLGGLLVQLAKKAIGEDFVANAIWNSRCRTCAFRLGSPANGSEATVGDAMKCIGEQKDFYCHYGTDDQRPVCKGYAAIRKAQPHIVKPANWEFSHLAGRRKRNKS